MRVLFFGTPSFAVASLTALVGEGFDVVGVVTRPDRPVGRHRSRAAASPVKEAALAEAIPVLQPERPSSEEFLRQAAALEPDVSVVETGIGDLTVAGRFVRGASPYGCRDMFGNVVQWCLDSAPVAPDDPDGRIVCGTSFDMSGEEGGCWRHEARKRLRRSRKCGFRCALDI